MKAAHEKATPLGRIVNVKEVASLIELIASPKMSMITGQNIPIEGGILLTPVP